MSASTGVLRVVEREARIFRHLWRGPVVLSFITPVMFLAAMGLGLGGLVDDGTQDLGGLDYLVFVAPGLMVANAMQVAAGESLWPVMGGKKWMGTYHAMVATPLRAADVFGGHVVWNGVRTALSASAFLVVATALGAVTSWWAPLAVPAAVLCAAAFSALLAAFSIGQDSDAAFPLIMRIGVVPLFLFSGTFFPVDQLPGWLRPLAVASPLWHSVELARGATTGQTSLDAVVAHTAALALFIGVGCWWGARRFTRELQA
jgi:lipooligosaccharide transport system permease protein